MVRSYKTIEEMPAYITVPELAGFLHIGKNSAYTLAHQEDFKACTIGKTIRIPKEGVLNFIEKNSYAA